MRQIASYSVYFGSPDQQATESSRPFQTNDDAKRARDAKYRELKKQGHNVYRQILKGQMRPYWSFGVPCGGFCDVYIINEAYND